MLQKLSLSLCLAFSLAFPAARDASAIPISPVDYSDSFIAGLEPLVLQRVQFDYFHPTRPAYPRAITGTISSSAWSTGESTYLYTQTVTPWTDMNLLYSTAFRVRGFTGVAGWSFASAAHIGATGTAADFHIEYLPPNDGLMFMANAAFSAWERSDPIRFFYVSTLRPMDQYYDLVTLDPSPFSTEPVAFSTALGVAPVPEPGSIALLGSGLVGLYATLRRRRAAKL